MIFQFQYLAFFLIFTIESVLLEEKDFQDLTQEDLIACQFNFYPWCPNENKPKVKSKEEVKKEKKQKRKELKIMLDQIKEETKKTKKKKKKI